MLLDLVQETVPEWFFDPKRNHWAKLAATIAVTLDALIEGVMEARLAAIPGQVDADTAPAMGGFLSVDALPLIGRDRRVFRGLSERPEVYAGRLRRWLEIWARAGTAWAILQELQSVLGPDSGVIRLVEASGVWWALYPDGTIEWRLGAVGWVYDPATGDLTPTVGTAHAWNWDGSSSPAPPDQDAKLRFWVIVRAPLNMPWCADQDGTFQDPGLYADYWDDPYTYAAPNVSPTAGTLGLLAPRKWIDLVRTVIHEHKVPGVVCKDIIVVAAAADADAFDPVNDSTPTSVPDGKWAWHTKYDAGTHSRIIARYPLAAYVPGD